jgi:hypothetical protein
MKYKTIDGHTVTVCRFFPEKFVGGFACAICEHWKSVAHHISGARVGDPGISYWDVGCSREQEELAIKDNNPAAE